MKIALVHCPFSHKIFEENLHVVDEEFSLAPPIVLAYVAAILEREGHNVILIDANALRLSMKKTLQLLQNFRPDMLCFRMDTYHFHQILEWIRYLKKHMNIPVVAGGINLTNYPKESLSHPEIDYGIIGEAIESLPRLVSVLENGDDVSGVAGVGYRYNGEVRINYSYNDLVDFDSYPFPARHLLPNERYCSFLSQRKNYTIMLTSTGCPFKCVFCVIAKIPYRTRSPENVVDEIEVSYHDFKVREIDFFDATLFINKDRIIKICQEIRRRRIKIEWSCRSRVDLVDEELLKEVSKAGCRKIYFGIESSNPQILKAINKGIDPERVKRAIKLSQKYGIRNMGFFMIGNPGETNKTIKETINFAKNLKLDFVQICRTIAKPCTDLDERLKKETGKDYWREYILGKVGERRLPTPWTDLTKEEIERYTKISYYAFYFRPWHILKIILRIKSFNELWRYIRVGLRMLFSYFSFDGSNTKGEG